MRAYIYLVGIILFYCPRRRSEYSIFPSLRPANRDGFGFSVLSDVVDGNTVVLQNRNYLFAVFGKFNVIKRIIVVIVAVAVAGCKRKQTDCG